MKIAVRRALRCVSPSPIVVLLLISIPLLSGCNVVQVVLGGMSVLRNGLPGEPSGMAGDSSGGMSQGDDGVAGGDSGEPGVVALACPSESTRFVLVANHSWSFSPAGQTQVMDINGTTNGLGCDIYVAGDVATGEDCAVDFTNTGVIHGDGGDCQVDGQGRGILSFEGTCQDGQITLTITEIHDPDTEMGGTMNCPGFSSPYATFYPPSLTTVTFMIDSAGATANESLNDITGFNYNKTWILMPGDAIP
jgi:hypothetical protein